MADINNEVLDWDSEIEDDGSGEFTVLEPGEYSFTVAELNRKNYNGSDKLPPCHQAELWLECTDGMGNVARVKDNIYLVKSIEWKISQLMRCIGQKQHGQRVKPDWSKVEGAHGRVRLKKEEYEYQGKKRTRNAVERYLDPVDTTPKYAEGKKPWQK